MKSNRTFLAVFFLLTTIGVSVLAYQQYLQLIQLKAKLGGPNDGLEKQLADDEKLIKSLRAQLAAAGHSRSKGALADAGDGSDSARPGGPPAAGDRRVNRGEAMRAIFNSPQFQALRTLQEKAQLDARYAALFKSLNLTPAQIDQLKNLLVQRQQAAGDAMQAAAAAGINPRSDPTAFRQAVADAQTDVDKQIQSTLGDSAYSQYQQYQQTLPQRATATQLQTALSYGTTPLTDAQSQQLINLMQTEAASSSNASTAAAGGVLVGPGGVFMGVGGGPLGGNQAASITADTISQAASFLSQPQVQALQQLQQTQQAQQQMQQLIRSGTGGGNRGAAKGG